MRIRPHRQVKTYDFRTYEGIRRFSSDHLAPLMGELGVLDDTMHTRPDRVTGTEAKRYVQILKESEVAARIINNALGKFWEK